MQPNIEDCVIKEQIEYYQRRAPEYDEALTAAHDLLAPQMTQIRAALDRFAPRGHVLELGCGTGTRTQWLLKHAHNVTALDASKAMLDRAQERVTSAGVRWILADVFTWEPVERYDVVFFTFWLSHVH